MARGRQRRPSSPRRPRSRRMEENMNCPTCKKQNTLRAWEGPITRMGVEIIARGQRCTSCGEELYDYEELGRQDALLADASSRADRS